MRPPSYLSLHRSGELRRRAEEAHSRLECCNLCAHACGVNRMLSTDGATCRTGARAVVSSAAPHFGEEAPLVGVCGSGTIFFSWCNLHCVFCQNADISQVGHGREVDAKELASVMLALEGQGCHNINLVSPSHVVPHFLAALVVAADRGLALPIVYNSGGYDAVETLRLLDGVMDIYMPDMKYSDPETAAKYSGAEEYPAVNRAAVREMHRQVGDLEMGADGVAERGLLVRHLVLPRDLAGTTETVRFLAQEVSGNTYLNVMAQYRPCYRAGDHPPLDRALRAHEHAAAVKIAEEAGLRLDQHFSRTAWYQR